MHHCWINGKVSEIATAQFHFNDLGVLRGYGLFDYFRTYNGKPFQWDWYWNRFEQSASILRIPISLSKDQTYQTVMHLLEKSGSKDCAFRFLLTGGFTEDSISMVEPNFFIISEDLHHDVHGEHERGIHVMTYEFVRDLPMLKSTDYKHLLILRHDFKAKGVTDVLYHKDGLISELSRSNVFIIKGNKLITPNENVLEGITRKTILQLAKDDFEIEIRPVTLEETLAADEVFTTSTTKRVLPITQIDGHVIASGKMEPKSKFLLEKIDQLIKNW